MVSNIINFWKRNKGLKTEKSIKVSSETSCIFMSSLIMPCI